MIHHLPIKPKGTPPSDLSHTPKGVALLINGERVEEDFPDPVVAARHAKTCLALLGTGATARIHVRGPFDSDPSIVRGRILAAWFQTAKGPVPLDRGAIWVDYFESLYS